MNGFVSIDANEVYGAVVTQLEQARGSLSDGEKEITDIEMQTIKANAQGLIETLVDDFKASLTTSSTAQSSCRTTLDKFREQSANQAQVLLDAILQPRRISDETLRSLGVSVVKS
ncbi:MAG: hypothetical protein H7Z43_14735 [Clostridia bacterium]|nr:hypothetical protein [Deltaproteobacteria bacterium]